MHRSERELDRNPPELSAATLAALAQAMQVQVQVQQPPTSTPGPAPSAEQLVQQLESSRAALVSLSSELRRLDRLAAKRAIRHIAAGQGIHPHWTS